MNPWEQLLAVQALDTTIRQLDHRDQQLPERATLAAIEDELVALRSRIDAAEADRARLAADQKRLEDEIAGIEAKIAKDDQQLYGGSTDPGVLQSLQSEIDAHKRRISHLEDDELELMEQIEPIDAQLATLADDLRALDERAIEATTALAEAESVVAAERDAATSERARLVADVDPAAVARYDAARERLGGVAVARLDGAVCGACHMKLSAVELDRIQHLPTDAEVECEDCGRFLVRS